MCTDGLARLNCRTGLRSSPAGRQRLQRCVASAQSANNCLRFSMLLPAMNRYRGIHSLGLATHCTIVGQGGVCPLKERRYAGCGDLMRGLRTICFILSSPQQLIFLLRIRTVRSVNAKTRAAAGCSWTVPTPARDGGAAWRTAATEIRPGSTTGARPVELSLGKLGQKWNLRLAGGAGILASYISHISYISYIWKVRPKVES